MTTHFAYEATGPRLPADAMRAFGAQLLQTAGATADDAAWVAETLVDADLRGVHSHGIRLTEYYVRSIERGGLRTRYDIREIGSGPGYVAYDGDHAPGQVAARLAMRRAIAIAKVHGVGTTTVRNAGHFGAAAYWALMAAAEGCVGYCTSNMPSAIVLAYGSAEGATGNTPLAWAFPTRDTPRVVLDMACGVAAHGRVAVAGTGGQRLPDGVGADRDGRMTNDPSNVKFVYPAGGPKGYALSIVHDLLAGALSGGAPTLLKPEGGPDQLIRGSQFHLAIDVRWIVPLADFTAEMDAQVRAVNALPPAEGFTSVSMPGQLEEERKVDRLAHGIPYPPGLLAAIEPLAGRLGVAIPWQA
ncbi:MAG: Ldh family oxidoreductase [Actinobacteria bacterium]|nr:Ldh family oxidoreductase [Actinomycetota bacterium]